MDTIEEQRLENIRQKEKLLADLRTERWAIKVDVEARRAPANQKRKVLQQIQPSRKSSRLVSGTKPIYNEIEIERKHKANEAAEARIRRPRTTRAAVDGSTVDFRKEAKSLVPIKNIDDIRAGWGAWKPTGPLPTRDDDGTIRFSDETTFRPNKTPEEMLREGCFGGSYFRPLLSSRLGVLVENDYLKNAPAGSLALISRSF